MCHLDMFGLNLDWWPYFVTLCAPSGSVSPPPTPLCPPGCVRRTQNGNNMEPNQCWSTSSGKFIIRVTFVFLLLLVFFRLLLSLLSLVVVSCCFFPFFAVTCSAHCGLFWKVARDEHGTQYIAKNMCQHQHDLFLEVPWFQFLPRHSPGTNTEPNMVPALSPSCGTLSTRCNSRKTQHGSQPGLPKSVQKSKGIPLGGGGGSLAEILGECLES